jgi:hypothetical protein
MTTAAMMLTWMATSTSVTGQDLQIERTEPAAIRVSVETLAQHVGQFAGLRVRVADAVVDRVVSPRVFVLTGQRPVVGLNGRDHVGVVVANGTASVVADMPIVVTGAAGTFSGAEVTGVLARTQALTDAERAALRKYPLVLAMSVETQGSVDLLRETPATAPAPAPAPAK